MLCDLYVESLQYQENLLAKYYTKNNHIVTIIASTFNSAFDFINGKYNKKDKGRIYWDDKTKIIKIPYSLNLFNKIRKIRNITKVLNTERPDVIFMHDLQYNIFEVIKYKKRNLNCKIIMDSTTDYSNSANNWLSLNILHKIIRRYLFNKSKNYIDRIFPITPATEKFLNEVYNIPYKKMNLLPLGADVDLCKEIIISNVGKTVRDSLKIPENDIVIFTGGKLTPAKKTDILIDAFLRIANSNLHLLIVGDTNNSDTQFRTNLIRKCNESNRIHFIGWVEGNQVYKYMNACDFAVFPASQSILWQQSISMGLPLIVGQVGIQDPTYLNKYNCIIIMKENNINTNTLANNILYLINNKNELNKMKENSLRTAIEILNYDRIIMKTLQDVNINSL